VQENKESPTLADLLSVLLENKGSDLHLQSGEVPIGRINGDLGRFEMPALTEADVLRLAREALGSEEKMQEFRTAKDCDAAIAIPELGRFRVNLFYQRNRPGMVLRTIGTKIPTIEQLELPEVLNQLCQATLADWGFLVLRSQFSNELELRSVKGLELSAPQKELIAAGKGFREPMLQSPRELVVKNFDEEEAFKSCHRFGFELPALLLSPILVENRLLGIIALGDHEPGQFDLNDVHLVRSVARQAGHAILNALHREEESARSRHSRQFVRF